MVEDHFEEPHDRLPTGVEQVSDVFVACGVDEFLDDLAVGGLAVDEPAEFIEVGAGGVDAGAVFEREREQCRLGAL